MHSSECSSFRPLSFQYQISPLPPPTALKIFSPNFNTSLVQMQIYCRLQFITIDEIYEEWCLLGCYAVCLL
jgi:hypothetical protein